ncbi:MAG TPA: type II toxin-antitoxin system VapC family toxin [Candidatus Levybacteria bacterium]|nr:type II toxin-antitoxin system VapC family toxin [Candidatus Levybacteria bacterium]
MKHYFLDTSVIIDYLHGKKETVLLVDSLGENISSSYICLAELFEGVYRVTKQKEATLLLMNLFSKFDTIFTIDKNVAEEFGKLRAELKINGTIIEDIDIFIAATCIAYNLILVTANTKHFSRIKKLDLYT